MSIRFYTTPTNDATISLTISLLIYSIHLYLYFLHICICRSILGDDNFASNAKHPKYMRSSWRNCTKSNETRRLWVHFPLEEINDLHFVTRKKTRRSVQFLHSKHNVTASLGVFGYPAIHRIHEAKNIFLPFYIKK